MRNETYESIRAILRQKGAAFAVLLDPDRESPEALARAASTAAEAGSELIYVGSSMVLSNNFGPAVSAIKRAV